MSHTFNVHISVTILKDFSLTKCLVIQLFFVSELWLIHSKCKDFCENALLLTSWSINTFDVLASVKASGHSQELAYKPNWISSLSGPSTPILFILRSWVWWTHSEVAPNYSRLLVHMSHVILSPKEWNVTSFWQLVYCKADKISLAWLCYIRL